MTRIVSALSTPVAAPAPAPVAHARVAAPPPSPAPSASGRVPSGPRARTERSQGIVAARLSATAKARFGAKIDDVQLLKTMRAVGLKTELDRLHDIPAVAGYIRRLTHDHNVTYIDRKLPSSFVLKSGVRVDVDPFLILHEQTEKSLIDACGLNYQESHQIALRTEYEAVAAAGIPWKEYDAFMQRYISSIEERFPARVPADLDLTPYRDEEWTVMLDKIKRALAKRGETVDGGDAVLAGGVRKDYGEEQDWKWSDVILRASSRSIVATKTVDARGAVDGVARCSADGKTVKIDKDLPAHIADSKGNTIDVRFFVVMHEAIKRALVDVIALSPKNASQIAMRSVRQATAAFGVDFAALDAQLQAAVG